MFPVNTQWHKHNHKHTQTQRYKATCVLACARANTHIGRAFVLRTKIRTRLTHTRSQLFSACLHVFPHVRLFTLSLYLSICLSLCLCLCLSLCLSIFTISLSLLSFLSLSLSLPKDTELCFFTLPAILFINVCLCLHVSACRFVSPSLLFPSYTPYRPPTPILSSVLRTIIASLRMQFLLQKPCTKADCARIRREIGAGGRANEPALTAVNRPSKTQHGLRGAIFSVVPGENVSTGSFALRSC